MIQLLREEGGEGGKRKEGRGTETEGGSQEGRNYKLSKEGVAEKRARTDRSDTKMDTEGGGEAGTSQSHSRHMKGHIE